MTYKIAIFATKTESIMSKDSLNLLKLAQSYERKTALSPICWILSVLVIASTYVFIFSDNVYIKVFFAVLIVVAIIYFGKVYWYLLKNDPDRLHSEKFILERQKLTMEAQKNKTPIQSNLDKDILEIKEGEK